MSDDGHTLFDTALGRCGLAWGPCGIEAVQLPEADDEATCRRLLHNAGKASQQSEATLNWPPLAVQAIAGIQALLRGESRQLLELQLNVDRLTPFQQRAYALARSIAPGSTRTYGDLAVALGDAGLARAVGQAMGHNPFAPVVPCHRVLAAGNKPGGFSANGGIETKHRMLAIEGALACDTLPLFPPN